MKQPTHEIITHDWGTIDYNEAFQRQEALFNQLIEAKKNGQPYQHHLIFCQHPHVYTLGQHGMKENMLLSNAELKTKGVSFVSTNRGGDITYHGPGQLVVYPILDLEDFGIGLREYIYMLEEVIILFLAKYKVKGERISTASGVWLGTSDESPERNIRKICAIGVKSSRFVTMHGLALNISPDMSFFAHITPCGIRDKGVTSMFLEGLKLRSSEVVSDINYAFRHIFLLKHLDNKK